ncbi:MAG: GNAT family N-acetyltransferase [Pseudomonadota bacterium]
MAMRVVEDALTCAEWEALCDLTFAPLQQRWAYGETVQKMGGTVCRLALYDSTRPVAFAQVLLRRIGWRIALVTRGPVWLEAASTADRGAAYECLRRKLREMGVRMIIVTPEEDAKPPIGHAIMTPSTVAHLTLHDDMRETLHGKWRNRLVRAEDAKCGFDRLTRRSKAHDWLYFQERKQRRLRGYKGLPRLFAETWFQVPSAKVLTFVDTSPRPNAGMMFLRHGTTATYHLGWTNDAGRARSLHTFMLWQAMRDLYLQGVNVIDLGLLDTERAPGLARFKLGTGAAARRLGPTTLLL